MTWARRLKRVFGIEIELELEPAGLVIEADIAA
jgi:hypothetical protein